MKKYLMFIPVLLFVSCVSSGLFRQDAPGERTVVIAADGISRIEVYKRIDFSPGSVIAVINAGETVLVLKKSDAEALVKTDDGKTGWIDIKFLKTTE